MDGVQFRAFQTRDIARVRDMFSEAFSLGTYSKNPWVMRHLLDHYLCSYLGRSTYTLIAEQGGRALGFLMGTTRVGERIRYLLMEVYHTFFLLFTRGGWTYFMGRRLISRADRAMKQEAPKADAELILFVVDSSVRGHGVGRELLRHFREHLKAEGAETMFLFTDDYSDVDYYRQRGYVQEGVREIRFSRSERSRFYLFSIPVNRVGGTGN